MAKTCLKKITENLSLWLTYLYIGYKQGLVLFSQEGNGLAMVNKMI
jgi:hypothetical protein